MDGDREQHFRRIRGNAGLLRDYGAALSGAGGRMVISLFYFVALANALSVADFGLFATASATGIMLSAALSALASLRRFTGWQRSNRS